MLQNEIAKQCAEDEIRKKGHWYQNDITRMLGLFKEMELEGEEYNILKSMSKYPHAILSGWTWNRIFGGLLNNKSVRIGISLFYENQYEELKDIKLAINEPIWVVIKSKKLDENRVYPVMVKLPDERSAVALAINVLG